MANPFHSARQVRNLLIQHEGGVEYCFVECIDCPASQSYRVFGGTRDISDAQAIAHFNTLGWTVRPTRCPSCAAGARIEPAFGPFCEDCRQPHALLIFLGGLWRCPPCAEAIAPHIAGEH